MSHFTSFVRIPALALRQHLRPLPRIGVLDQDALQLRAWPNDIDFNLHMNNARYLGAMDYGRMHLLARAGLLDHILRSRWQPLVGAVWVTYRRSLPLFAPFHAYIPPGLLGCALVLPGADLHRARGRGRRGLGQGRAPQCAGHPRSPRGARTGRPWSGEPSLARAVPRLERAYPRETPGRRRHLILGIQQCLPSRYIHLYPAPEVF